uniref:Uncharacterized protein n=1 Tax=Anopheles dirus TaxID=7168 RepID=A0A182NDS2_9DIPT
MHRRILVYLFIVLFCFGLCKAQGGNQKCAQNGEYCLTHRECCSGSCLSFSYKCVPVPASASIGTISVPVNPLPIDTENRFGGDDGGASLTQKTCALNGEYCQTHAECCSGSCLTFSYKCVPLNPPGSTVPVSHEPTPQLTPVSFTNRIGDEASSTVTASTTKKCAGIGEYLLTKTHLQQQYLPLTDLAAQTRAPETLHASCFHNKECCSGACYKSICSTEIRIGVPESELTRPSVANGPYIPVNDLDDLITRFGSQPSTADQTANRKERQCKVIGDTCNRHEDCCSSNCHSYKRKCVN